MASSNPGRKSRFWDQKAWFRVQWVGKEGSSRAGRVGVRCLEPSKYVWGVPPKEWRPDAYDLPAREAESRESSETNSESNIAVSGAGGERRRFPREACRIDAPVIIEGNQVRLPARVIDISLGGCYVEMLAPLPADTIVDLSLNPGHATVHVTGPVRSSQRGIGMGVSFM